MTADNFLHAFGNGDAEHCEDVFENILNAKAKAESCLHKSLVVAINSASVIELMEEGCNSK